MRTAPRLGVPVAAPRARPCRPPRRVAAAADADAPPPPPEDAGADTDPPSAPARRAGAGRGRGGGLQPRAAQRLLAQLTTLMPDPEDDPLFESGAGGGEGREARGALGSLGGQSVPRGRCPSPPDVTPPAQRVVARRDRPAPKARGRGARSAPSWGGRRAARRARGAAPPPPAAPLFLARAGRLPGRARRASRPTDADRRAADRPFSLPAAELPRAPPPPPASADPYAPPGIPPAPPRGRGRRPVAAAAAADPAERPRGAPDPPDPTVLARATAEERAEALHAVLGAYSRAEAVRATQAEAMRVLTEQRGRPVSLYGQTVALGALLEALDERPASPGDDRLPDWIVATHALETRWELLAAADAASRERTALVEAWAPSAEFADRVTAADSSLLDGAPDADAAPARDPLAELMAGVLPGVEEGEEEVREG